eukprot:COSAG01_NODE_19832_length_986_cov_2.317926_1_plen_117_part_00
MHDVTEQYAEAMNEEIAAASKAEAERDFAVKICDSLAKQLQLWRTQMTMMLGWCGWFGLVRGWCANHFSPLMRFYALSEVCVCEYLKNLILSCGWCGWFHKFTSYRNTSSKESCRF